MIGYLQIYDYAMRGKSVYAFTRWKYLARNAPTRTNESRRFSQVVPVAQWHVNAVIGLGLTGRSAATCAIHGQPIAAASPKPRARRVAVPFTVLCFADATVRAAVRVETTLEQNALPCLFPLAPRPSRARARSGEPTIRSRHTVTRR